MNWNNRGRLALILGMVLPMGVARPDEFFTSKIEPLLKKHCYECHSHGGKMKGGLTLDSKSGWEQGGEHGAAIVPGKPEASLLFQAVEQKTGKLKMPPRSKLSDGEIALLKTWIGQGASDPRKVVVNSTEEWWSLKKLTRPAVPPGAVNPIDAFIQNTLREKSLRPSPVADRRTLIRRVYHDVIGLPPTFQEVEAFVKDPDGNAYGKLVDRLLASPRYGEKWSRHWLDTIHFAETHGFEHDLPRTNAWRYRDYVIESLNRDKSWDRFIREQLAADKLYPEDPGLVRALGFLGAGTFDASSYSTAPVTFDYLDRDDLVTQTMAAFVSTTANCARCHAHKFDPISQEDYYSLQAVFAGIVEGNLAFDEDSKGSEPRQKWNNLLLACKSRDKAILLGSEYEQVLDTWAEQNASSTQWELARVVGKVESDGSQFKLLEDGSYLGVDKSPDKETYVLTGEIPVEKITAIRLEVLAHDSLPKRGPGRQDNGNLHLSEFELLVQSPGQDTPKPVPISKATADFNQEGWGIARAIDGKPETAWGIYPEVGNDHQAVFELAQPLQASPQSKFIIRLKQLHGARHLIGRFRISTTGSSNPSLAVMPEKVADALKKSASARAEQEKVELAAHVLRSHAEAELKKLSPRAMVYAAGPVTEVVTSLGQGAIQTTSKPKKVEVLRRGDFDKPLKEAFPGALSAIPWLKHRFDIPVDENESFRRAALAQWIADQDNPLTWRSIANRVWHYHFGRGICDTPGDFGKMGGIPSHPQLLDWLGCEIRDNHGSLKHLHRLILNSQTYQQVSRSQKDAVEVDADNRLLWRQNIPRLDADGYRDFLIASAGSMDFTLGGPSVRYFKEGKPVQSTPTLDYDAYDWKSQPLHRRSIYRFVWRGIPDPFLEALDFPDLGLLTPKRADSSSALQALAMYNNKFVLHFSSDLAQKIQGRHADTEVQVREVVRTILLREPSPAESKQLGEYVLKHGLAALCRVLFNSNEFLYVS